MSWEIKQGDALERLREMPDESVHCCVTSPPYWGLRDYGTAPVIFGRISTCSHKWQNTRYYTEQTAAKCSADAFSEAGEANAARLKDGRWRDNCWCVFCDAWQGQLGLEPTPELFVEHMVAIFREVRRVLRSDGTLWLNMGDSYTAGGRGGGGSFTDERPGWDGVPMEFGKKRGTPGLKPKDLCGIPWLLAFALRSDGWYLRQDIIWSKPNPMPESVTDRCTKAHEYLFLLSKSARYYYDAEAIKEECEFREDDRPFGSAGGNRHGDECRVYKNHRDSAVRRREVPPGQATDTGFENGRYYTVRNRRSVWEVTTQPFPEAHFATFPPKLIEPCILAGCPECGTVLDPFAGAGTTGLVATRLQRNFIGIELNSAYVEMAGKRITQDAPLFNSAESYGVADPEAR